MTPAQSTNAAHDIQWVVSTEKTPWLPQPAPQLRPMDTPPSAFILDDRPGQTIDGFGVSFSELGWAALGQLTSEERDSILEELFAPGVGANFRICRMPIGANDYSTEWYSYDEHENDFDLEHFSIDHDRATLIPYIQAAQKYQPQLRLWASPWSPPTWMKTNHHYAGALPWPGSHVENGLRPDQVASEGTDQFIQAPEYFKTYARYFAKFIESYHDSGIAIEMVMPQNEFNSAQVFPSCTWTPAGLARFISHLGPEMDRLGVQVFLGTQERPDVNMFAAVMADADAGRWIKGGGFQWAGKHAVAEAHKAFPALSIYQSEQECGDGKNDWRYCRYTWSLMKQFLTGGANSYMYWNLAVEEGGVSRWGWGQNSLVVVDPATASYRYTHEYYLLKHLSHFLQQGAVRLETLSLSGYENQLAFLNPDGTTVVVVQNDLSIPMPITFGLRGQVLDLMLPADSFSTIVLPETL